MTIASHVRKVNISERIQHVLEKASQDGTESYLKRVIQTISRPRHYVAEHAANEQVGQWIQQEFLAYGYRASRQGAFGNIVALPAQEVVSPVIVIAAHYDTVPGSPGADDNGSGMAVLLACARLLAICCFPESTIFVAFNREEDTLMGSFEFMHDYLRQRDFVIAEAHVLEMVGYCSHLPGSQRTPQGFPIHIPDRGDFLGLIGNRISIRLLDSVLSTAKTYLEEFPVIGLKVYLGLEKYFMQLQRSDHAPFWHAKIPALMWTDTAEFRNPHYHQPEDTPETLDYVFMLNVTKLIASTIIAYEEDFQE